MAVGDDLIKHALFGANETYSSTPMLKLGKVRNDGNLQTSHDGCISLE